jgi:hypothetical protein
MFLMFLKVSPNPGNNTRTNIVHNVRSMYHESTSLLADTNALGPIGPNVTLAFGDKLHEELQHFVEEMGKEPAEAINAATRVAAKFHRLYDREVIREGMRRFRCCWGTIRWIISGIREMMLKCGWRKYTEISGGRVLLGLSFY